MGLLDERYGTVNGKKPRKSDRINQGQEMNVRGLLDAAQNIPVAGDVLSGVMAAYDAAKGDYGSAAMNALGVLPFVSGTFIGKGAKTWDAVKAADAEKRIAAGDDVRKVWKETGTFKGPDGHLRQEIDDSKAYIKGQSDNLYDASSRASSNGIKPTIDTVLFHPRLEKAYPDVRNIPVEISGIGKGGSYGESMLGEEGIRFGTETIGTSTPIHELQHAIQHREGFARGGSMDNAPVFNEELLGDVRKQKKQLGIDPYAIMNRKSSGYFVSPDDAAALDKYHQLSGIEDDILSKRLDPYDAYRRLAGEAEARATQSRMNMNMEQRLNTYPLDSYDVPVDQLIIRGGLLK